MRPLHVATQLPRCCWGASLCWPSLPIIAKPKLDDPILICCPSWICNLPQVVDLDSFLERRTYVINGPTSDDQPIFRWSTADATVAGGVHHEGCVDEFTFGWQSYASVMGPIYKSGAEPDV